MRNSEPWEVMGQLALGRSRMESFRESSENCEAPAPVPARPPASGHSCPWPQLPSVGAGGGGVSLQVGHLEGSKDGTGLFRQNRAARL